MGSGISFDEEPDRWGRFSTRQVIQSLWGPGYEQRIGLLREKTEAIRAKTAETLAGLIPVSEIKGHQEAVFNPIREAIESWPELDAKAKASLLRHLPL
jgi:hypothetical protein